MGSTTRVETIHSDCKNTVSWWDMGVSSPSPSVCPVVKSEVLSSLSRGRKSRKQHPTSPQWFLSKSFHYGLPRVWTTISNKFVRSQKWTGRQVNLDDLCKKRRTCDFLFRFNSKPTYLKISKEESFYPITENIRHTI